MNSKIITVHLILLVLFIRMAASLGLLCILYLLKLKGREVRDNYYQLLKMFLKARYSFIVSHSLS